MKRFGCRSCGSTQLIFVDIDGNEQLNAARQNLSPIIINGLVEWKKPEPINMPIDSWICIDCKRCSTQAPVYDPSDPKPAPPGSGCMGVLLMVGLISLSMIVVLM